METEENNVIIATQDVEKALYIIAKEAMLTDEIEIQFIERYAPTVEYILRILRKCFGWQETDRGEKESYNNKCIHNQKGYCQLAKNLKERNTTSLKCTEAVRRSCKYYKARYTEPMLINYVTITKAGGIRGM